MRNLLATIWRLRLVVLVYCVLHGITSIQHGDHVSAVAAEDYDTVILNGRVMDPESELDAVCNIGISDGTIQKISTEELTGRAVIDAQGLIVSPGFIDLHEHGQVPESYRFQVRDGVTTTLELEVGTDDVDAWYAEREGKTIINHGVSIGHIPVRMRVMNDPGDFLPSGDAGQKIASEAELEACKQGLEQGLKRGAVAVGFGIAYTAAASSWEIVEMFRVAARYDASCHVHVRGGDPVMALGEVIAATAVTGAPLHVVHINSSGRRQVGHLLQIIDEARGRGMDVTTECYPYAAGMTSIESALFDWWKDAPEDIFSRFQWVATGERLTKESFGRYREKGGFVIIHSNTDAHVRTAVLNPLTMIASDGIAFQDGKSHPRSSGTYARILGRYVREMKALNLMDALRKMTLMPAQRLEHRVPMMKNKGRIRVGADADLTIFDAERVIDKSTYEDSARYSEGIEYVLVNGIAVVKEGQLQIGVAPGQPVRAPIQ